MHILKQIFFRAVFVYMLGGAFWFFVVDQKSVASHAWPKTLSRLRPSYAYLLSAVNEGTCGQDSLVDGKRYFKAINRIFGSRPDANAFLGMSEYYLGHKLTAESFFQKLKAELPGFFWADYNLALLALERKDYEAAENFAKQVIMAPLDKSLVFMMSAKVYQPLLVENGLTPQILASHMQEGKLLLVRLMGTLKNGGPVSFEDDHYPVRVF